MGSFEEVQSKATRAYAHSGQYHTIMESCVRLTISTIIIQIRESLYIYIYIYIYI